MDLQHAVCQVLLCGMQLLRKVYVEYENFTQIKMSLFKMVSPYQTIWTFIAILVENGEWTGQETVRNEFRLPA
jgi:hypothetical protein